MWQGEFHPPEILEPAAAWEKSDIRPVRTVTRSLVESRVGPGGQRKKTGHTAWGEGNSLHERE